MNVLQVLLGQSASVMQPRFAFAPPTQAPVSQVPEAVQSALLHPPELHAVARGEQSAVVVHVEAQSALVRHAVLSFDVNPWTQRLLGGVPPAVSAADAPLTVSVVPLAHAALVIERP